MPSLEPRHTESMPNQEPMNGGKYLPTYLYTHTLLKRRSESAEYLYPHAADSCLDLPHWSGRRWRHQSGVNTHCSDLCDYQHSEVLHAY